MQTNTKNRIEQIDNIIQSVFVEIKRMHDDHRFQGAFLKNMAKNQFKNISVETEEVDRYADDILINFETVDWNNRQITFAGRLSRGVFWSATINGRGYTGGEIASVMTDQQWDGFIEYSNHILQSVKDVAEKTTKEVVAEDFSFVSRKP